MTRRRLSTLTVATAVALFGIGASAGAAPIIWDFNPPYPPYNGPFFGPVGASSYTVDSDPRSYLLLTASGFDTAPATFQPAFGDTPHELFWKDAGVDEHGIGLVDTSDFELTLDAAGNTANYTLIDLLNIFSNPAVTNAQIRVQSVTGGEAWDLWGWNGAGYTLLETGNLDNNVFRPLPAWGTYRGYAVAVTPSAAQPYNNVLFDAISAEFGDPPPPVPEPGTIALLGGGLALLASRRKASRSARK
jgi:hypothetical protein